jgi:phthiocerol/phenolphthiocerol synthesis type-I polyketide synthase E
MLKTNNSQQPTQQPEHTQQVRRSASEIQQWLLTKLSEMLAIDPASIDITAPLKNYGLHSVNAVGLSGDLEQWLGRTLSPTLLYSYPSITQLVTFLANEADTPFRLPEQPDTDPKTTNEPIAIVGMACRFPGDANTPEAFWQLLKRGKNAVTDIPSERWNIDDFYDPSPTTPGKMYTRHGCFMQDISLFDAHFFEISAREALRMEPQQRILLEVAWEALENAGIASSSLAGSRTGVFVGMMNNQEYAQLQISQGDGSHVDDPYFGIGSASSIAAGRLAYVFDFQGPTLTVDTACSSSLVATHLACQSLRNNDCNLALVGGTSSVLLADTIVNACKMGMLSSDGLCKSFDASADGFVMGEGCGVVVLKRLSAALADGNPILAVIRGSAVNQDGRSNGITAPNQLAQEAVIRSALTNARVDPLQVSYVEAHGSGTALGDPIEIEALHTVLGPGRTDQQHLMVGSVKTNVGHLTGAAGIAGLIKTVLALQHREIPPHLNLTDLNPHVPWEKRPIIIPTFRTPWTSEQETRIAGVSSFGWSGTNAHLILAEAPTLPNTTTTIHRTGSDPQQENTHSPYMLVLSAKTETALEKNTDNLIAYLSSHPQVPFADVVYTLQAGRNRLQARRILLCHNREDAIAALSTRDPKRIITSIHNSQTAQQRPVAFLFPGLGERSVQHIQQLYKEEVSFRATVDRCCAFLQNQLGLDLSELFSAQALNSASPHATHGETRPVDGSEQLMHNLSYLLGRSGAPAEQQDWQHYKQTELAQPVMFLLEYALAQVLMQWGVRPQALLGYSLGEYVAACLAGVFSLEDALTLVTRRAQLIQQQAPGIMLAVALSEELIQPYLSAQVSLAVINAPSTCVLSGTATAITLVEQQLQMHEIAYRRVETTHAFHSVLLEPVQAPLSELVRTITLHAPQIPYLSNVTGDWITAEQATDPSYWAAHMCQTVRFADDVAHLLENTQYALLEVGPGKALSSFVKQHPACTREHTALIFAPLSSPKSGEHSHYASLLITLGKLWLAGVPIRWQGLYTHERRSYVPLYNYAFERQRHWFTTQQSSPQWQTSTAKKSDMADWFSLPLWKQAIPPEKTHVEQRLQQKACWLLLTDGDTAGSWLIQALQAHNQDVITVQTGTSWMQHSAQIYQLRPGVRSDYQALFQALRAQGKTPQHIVHLWTVEPRTFSHDLEEQDKLLQYSFYSLLAIAQASGDGGEEPCSLSIISTQVHDVLGHEILYPTKASLIGASKVIAQEYAHLTCRVIDLDSQELANGRSDVWQDQLLREIVLSTAQEMTIALRSGRRWLPSYEPLHLPTQSTTTLRQNGVYLITGGLGGIGLAVAYHLAQSVQARLVLLGRQGLPERSQWPHILQDTSQEQALRQIHHILRMEEAGSEVLVLQADVANEAQMHTAIQQAISHFGPIQGIFHAAGVPGTGLLQFKTPEQAAAVLRPKVQGTLVLERIFDAHSAELDFLVLFSSVTAMIGGAGQMDYSAANAFLSAYAQSHHHKRYKVLAIDWSEWQWNAWEEGLVGYGDMADLLRENRKRFGLSFEEGIEALMRMLSSTHNRIIVSTQDFQQVLALGDALTVSSIFQQKQLQQSMNVVRRPALENSYVAPRNELERQISALWARLLHIEQVGIHDNFFDLGGNSLLGGELMTQTRKLMNVADLPAYVLFEAPSVGAMAQYLNQHNQHEPDTQAHKTQERGDRRRESIKQRGRETRRAR